MVVKSFPRVDLAGPEGLLAIGGDLEIPTLQLAYQKGIFPWPTEDFPLLWFAPPYRAILNFSELRIPKRYQRERKKFNFHFKIDQQFSKVIHACAEGLTRNSEGTWITDDIIRSYIKFHEAGYAHSFECYNTAGQLVGGMYGVSLGGMFAGESMFFWESSASKETLIFVCDELKRRGAEWMDIQMMSPLLERFGARDIPRTQFMACLRSTLKAPPLFPLNFSD